MVDYRTLKASLGTTKYCSSFLRNVPCPNPECMYLHELGDDKVSYTKEDMLAGKHQSDVTVSAEDEAAALAAANAAAAAVKSQPVVKAPVSRRDPWSILIKHAYRLLVRQLHNQQHQLQPLRIHLKWFPVSPVPEKIQGFLQLPHGRLL